MATIDRYKIVLDVEGQAAVDRLKNSLGGLGTLLSSIAGIGFASSVLKMADSISDLADATGFAVKEIVAFQTALQGAGGKAEDANRMLVTFFKNIDGAAKGGEDAQNAFKKIGISLNDIAKLSDKELLTKTLEGLAKIPAGAERSAAGIELFGKSFNSIDPKKLAEAINTGDFSKIEESLRKAGDLADSLAANFNTLQLAGAQVFSDILSTLEPFIGKLENGRISLEQAEKIIKTVGIAFAAAFGAKVIGAIIDVVKVIKSLNIALKAQAVLQTSLLALAGPKGWALIAAAGVAAGAAVAGLNALLGDNEEKQTDVTKAIDETTKAVDNQNKKLAGRKVQLLTDKELEAQKLAILQSQEQTKQIDRQNQAALKYKQIIIDTIGIAQEEAELIRNNAQLEIDAAEKIADLQSKIEIEKQKGRNTNQGLIVEYQAQQNLISNQVEKLKQLNTEEFKRLQAIKDYKNAQDESLKNVNLANEQARYLTEQQIKQNIILGKSTEKQTQLAIELFNLETEHYKNLNNLFIEKTKAQADGNKTVIDNISREEQRSIERFNFEKQKITERYDYEKKLQQSAIAGTIASITQIADSLTPYKLAQDAITQGWSKIGNAVDEFVMTGKFKFKDFTISVLQDLAKIIIKAQLFQAISGAAKYFGLSIPGLAEGGPAKANMPYIVGEKGPELFVPKAPGTVIPNKEISSSIPTHTNTVTAPVTNNYITNNISAIDAKSVAQLFAENRKTLLGTVRMAEKEMPYSNR